MSNNEHAHTHTQREREREQQRTRKIKHMNENEQQKTRHQRERERERESERNTKIFHSASNFSSRTNYDFEPSSQTRVASPPPHHTECSCAVIFHLLGKLNTSAFPCLALFGSNETEMRLQPGLQSPQQEHTHSHRDPRTPKRCA